MDLCIQGKVEKQNRENPEQYKPIIYRVSTGNEMYNILQMCSLCSLDYSRKDKLFDLKKPFIKYSY
jgi:hypothetical protein